MSGLLTARQREAEAKLRDFLCDRDAHPAVIDALHVAMYGDDEGRSAAARLLVEAGAPLSDRIVQSLDEVALWQPWVPLALLSLTHRDDEVREAAQRLDLIQFIDVLG